MAAFVVVNDEIERAFRRERVFRDRTKQLEVLNDEEIVSRYRLTRNAIFELLQLLGPRLQRETRRSRALSPETQLLATLRYLGKGGFLLENGDLHGIAESSTSRACHQTVISIVKELNNIYFPEDVREVRAVKEKFHRIAGFPRVVGAIDGTLIAIKRPAPDEEAAYVCRKGFHAINAQAVCDSDLRFLNVVAKWPGSSHDSMILSNSMLGQKFETTPPDGYLLGDSGYACRSWLLTPVSTPVSQPEERYNQAHAKTRNTVERAFGVLKSRFRCLHKSTGCLQFCPTRCVNIIMACFKLHNFCISMRLPPPPPLENDDGDGDDDDDVQGQKILQDGQRVRSSIIQKCFAA